MLWVGPSALLPPGAGASGLAFAFVAAGGGGLALLLGGFYRRTVRAVRSTVPHLYPFGPVSLDVAMYLLAFAVVTCFTHAFFDVFTGADNGGQVDGLVHQATLSAVLWAASVVVYLAALGAVILIARVVRLGRQIDRRRSVDPYRRGEPEPRDDPERPEPLLSGDPAPARSAYARPVLYGVSVLVAVGMSAAVQLLEANLQPAPAVDWLASQAFTPVWALLTAAGLAYLDSGTRRLEARFVSGEPAVTGRSSGSGQTSG